MLDIGVALVCDFFLPALGGVQMHIYYLATYLQSKVRRVVVITHEYDNYTGCITYPNGLTVYYIPLPYSRGPNIVYLTYFWEYPSAKEILLRENIDIVHCHQTFSTLALSYAVFAKMFGMRLVHTEHSLFGYRSMAEIHLNAMISYMFPHYQKIICVSRTVRNNIILRSGVSSDKTIVIPNAILSNSIRSKQGTVHTQSKESSQCQKYQAMTILVVGRLVYRRGTDLLMEILPTLCLNHPRIKIKIIGVGPKSAALRIFIERHGLSAQVEMLGAKSNSDTLAIMKKCHIFLNTALTESFGIALVEAAAAGLRCVSTLVGGIGEILPSLRTAPPQPIALLKAVEDCIQEETKGEEKPIPFEGYAQEECFERVVDVYRTVGENRAVTRQQFIRNVLRKFDPALLFIMVVVVGIIIMDLIEEGLKKWKEIIRKK